jgi:hypothetical protein
MVSAITMGTRVRGDGATRLVAEERLLELRERLRGALAQKKLQMATFVEACKADRRVVREHVQEMRARSLRHLRDQIQAARAAAKLTRLTRLAEIRQAAGAPVERARAAVAVERQHQTELARLEREERSRRVEIRLAHERSLATNVLRSSLFGKLAPLFEREGRAVARAAGESRAESLLRFAEKNPEKMHAVLEPAEHRKIEETKRALADAERSVRASGGDPRALAHRPHEQKDRRARFEPAAAHGAWPAPGDQAIAPIRESSPPPPPSPALSASPVTVTPSAPETVPAAKLPARKPGTARARPGAKKHATGAPTRPSKRGKSNQSKGVPRRRRGENPKSGILVADVMRERAELSAAKAVRGKRRATKVALSPKPALAPQSLLAPTAARKTVAVARVGQVASLPHVPAANTNAPPVAKRPKANAARVGSTSAEGIQPYRVRASCGHVVVRPMTPATAGVPYSETVVIDAPKGRACEACEAKRDPQRRSGTPAAEKSVKAAELRDTAEVAKRIRADVSEAVRAKKLPKGSYSVKTDKYSMGSSISIVASKLPFPVLNPAAFRLEKGSSHVAFDRDRFRSRYTSEAEAVLAALNAIVDAYHWDRSDPVSDYHNERFGRDVRLDDEGEWKRINAEKVAAARATTGVAQ